MSPGANLDAAISGLTTRVESARRTASELTGVTESNSSSSDDSASSKGGSEDGKGAFVDVTA